MTTPGGVPNLPAGALTLETLAAKLQDMSVPAMRERAAARVPNIFDGSTAGNLLSDLSPGGVIAQLFAGFNSFVANADPADIQGPEDLPGLLTDFIESLPVVGQLVGLGEAIMGTYDGDDEVLLAIQEVFEPIRALLQVVGGVSGAELPTVEQILDGWAQLAAAIGNSLAKLRGLIDISWLTNEHQNLVDESGYDDPITVESPDDPNITHDATDGVPGSTPLGCMKIVCNGANHERGGKLIEVGRGWVLEAESAVKWEVITATAAANAIRLELQPFSVVGTVATPVGGRVLVGSVASPSGSSGGSGGWGTSISGNYTVPSDGSVTHVALFPRVTSAASVGLVKFDNTNLVAIQDIPQEFIKDLLADLQSLLDWITAWVDNGLAALGIPPIGSLFDRINDLADGISEIQNNAEDAIAGLADKLGLDEWDDWLADAVGGWQALLNKFKGGVGGTLDDVEAALNNAGQDIRDAIANALGHSGTGHTSAQIATYLANIPQGVITGLTDLATQTNQIVDILAGNAVTAINATVQAVKDWFAQWFGGGSTNAIPLSQKGAASGVAPLNSSTKLATSYLQTNVANGVAGLDSSGKVATSLLVTDTANNVPTLDSGGKLKGGQLPDFSSTYIPVGQKGAALGVAPLNGSSVIPLEYLPEEVGGSGGSGDGRPYVILSLSANQSITTGGLGTEVAGWSQAGSAGVTFADGTNTRWRFNQAGWWQMEMTMRWPSSNSTGVRDAWVTRYQEASLDDGATWGVSKGVFQAPIASAAFDWQNVLTTSQRVSDFETSASGIRVRFSDDDYFGITVRQTAGSSQNVLGGYPYPIQQGSFVVCTYLGAA
ncbi:hypothetical protein [Mycobacterium sp. 48b]|uniref:hypothetical protein n=1 Tax=Mycobacterium sp. 48b TaxID=3400426 RepID=UPI003AAEF798